MTSVSFKRFSVKTQSEALLDFYLMYKHTLDYGCKQFNQELSLSLEETFLSLVTEEYNIYGDDYWVTIALIGDIPVGFMTYTCNLSYHVSSLWVKPEFRRQGIGKSLIGILVEGKLPITLFVQKNARLTQLFYSGLFFKQVNEFKRSFLLERAIS